MTPIGPYRILKRLQMTETSEVLLAASGDNKVVIKRLLAGVVESDPSMAESLVCEATAYARLHHPCVVRMLDFIEDGGRTSMVLEYIEGATLERLLDDLRFRREKLPRAAALRVASSIFAALEAAHAAREPTSNAHAPIIHRDVSPGNVLLTREGEVKLSDFGFAKLLGKDSKKTAFGIIKGTFGYMAPEQVLEQPVTVRADVYCGAVVAWELLTGKTCVVLSGLTHLDALMKMASPNIAPIEKVCPDVAPAIAEALGRALQTDAERRDITAAELHDVFKRESSAIVDEGRVEIVRLMKRAGLISDLAVAVAAADLGGHDAEPPGTQPRAAAPDVLPAPPQPQAASAVASTRGVPRSRGFLAAGALAAVACAVVFAVLWARRAEKRPEAEPRPTLPAVTAVSAASAVTGAGIVSAVASVVPVAAAPSAPSPSHEGDVGELDTRAAVAGRRIFVDGRVVGTTGEVVRVPCGARSVRIGSAGSAKQVDVPCGGVVPVD